MARILYGKEVTAAINARTAANVETLKKLDITPTLGIIRMGNRPDDLAYENSLKKRCSRLGLGVKLFALSESDSTDSLLRIIEQANSDADIHGVLIFMPLPAHVDRQKAADALDPAKDIDGITIGSMAGIYSGRDIGFAPCTPKACMEMLDYYGIDCAGRRAVVVGRSLVVGKPAALMLTKRNATVTICHTKTADLASVIKEADIVIAAAGKAGSVGADCIREGQIIIDVGINLSPDGGICGDVDLAAAVDTVEAITPVPGGVGTVTTAVLLENVTKAAIKAAGPGLES